MSGGVAKGKRTAWLRSGSCFSAGKEVAGALEIALREDIR